MKERVEAYLGYMAAQRGMSANTVSAYRNDLSQFAEFLEAEAAREGVAGLSLASVDRERLGGYFLFLRERAYAPASVARKIAAVKSFFHYLYGAGEIPSDPTHGIAAPEVKKGTPRSISSDEVSELFARAEARQTPEAVRDAAMLRLLYATGMRVSELVTLDVDDVDPEAGSATAGARGRRPRTLPYDAETAASLRAYLQQARPLLLRDQPSSPALFLNHRGQRLTRQGFWLIMKGLARGTPLEASVTPHTLRHTFATHRLREGVALRQLQHLLGHASLTTTQVYAPRPTEVPRPANGHAVHALPAVRGARASRSRAANR